MIVATVTEVKNNFDNYLMMVQTGRKVVIMDNGFEVARLIPVAHNEASISDSLVGILSSDAEEKKVQEERQKRFE